MRLFFARHGQSQANLLREFSNHGWKHPLTALGREQAAALAERLRPEGIARIYTSPLLRAVETAQIVSQRLAVPINVTPALVEYDTGVYEGRSDEASWQEYARVRADWLNGKWESRMASGESLIDIHNRFAPFIRRLQADAALAEAAVLCISHGGLYLSALPFVLENVSYGLANRRSLGNTDCILVESRASGLFCLEWAGEKI